MAYFAREGYYAKDDRRHYLASSWHGGAARALGLPRHVSSRVFERILTGYVPRTEIRLGRARDGEHQHRRGLDLTLSAPKSISLEALLHGDRRVVTAHDAAVRASLDWVEAELLQTRGYDPATGRRPRVAADGLVAATFRHLTSRDQDPQLHTHCILANVTQNRAGERRSMEPTETVDVPELRIVVDELWQAAKDQQAESAERYAAVIEGVRAARENPLNAAHRPHHLLSGLL